MVFLATFALTLFCYHILDYPSFLIRKEGYQGIALKTHQLRWN